METHFAVKDGTMLYRQTYPYIGGNAYSFVWEFSRALLGTLALAGVPANLVAHANYGSAVQTIFRALEHYFDARAKPPAYDSYVRSQGGGDKYHDDNAWIALAHLQHYRMGLSSSLDRAKQLYRFGASGWDTNPRDPDPGGIFWIKQGVGFGATNHDRGAGATAANAEIAYHLDALTGSAIYAGDDMLEWVETYLSSATGLYYNVVRIDGSIDTNLWSYNQGVMIGANVLRYQLTGSTSHLEKASAIAEAALSTYGNFQSQPPSFNVMLFQNMLQLYPHTGSTLQQSMLQAMQAYADWAWSNSSVRSSKNVFYFDDAGHPVGDKGAPAQLRDQGAMIQLYALLAWRESDYGKLT